MREFLDRATAVLLAVMLHALIAVALWFGIGLDFSKPQPVNTPVVQATIVDIDTFMEQRRAAEPEPPKPQPAPAKPTEELSREVMQRKPEPEPAKPVQRRPDPNQEVMAEAKRRQQEAEKQLAEIRRQRELAEQDRIREEQRLEQLREQRKEQAEIQRRELERQRQQQLLAQEQREADLANQASLRQQYVGAIRQLITGNWLRPPTAQPGLTCRVRVNQIPGGEVVNAAVISPCNADNVVQQSITDAVLRSEPLPYRGFEKVFERELTFTFRYEG